MPKLVLKQLSPYLAHVHKWKDCQLCPLSTCRKQPVLFKGSIPCDVLVIGEAPGKSENQLGLPFIGPAGHLLDEMIAQALNGQVLRIGYTYLVACFPKEETGYRDPTPKEVIACGDRLNELVDLCKPMLLVYVGRLAEKAGPVYEGAERVSILSPAAIMKADISQKQLAIQRTIVTLSAAFQRLAEGGV